MISKETVPVEATTRVVEREFCDVCKKEIVLRGGTSQVNEVEVVSRIGHAWGSDSNIDALHFDMCTDCFRDKLVPWMREQFGATPRAADY